MTSCEGSKRALTCPKTKTGVRIYLALFAVTNFCMGMSFFMFLLCSSSEIHRDHLLQLVGIEVNHVHKDGSIK